MVETFESQLVKKDKDLETAKVLNRELESSVSEMGERCLQLEDEKSKLSMRLIREREQARAKIEMVRCMRI